MQISTNYQKKKKKKKNHSKLPMARPKSSKPRKPRTITFIHPDLGIGGAERLILDAALSLQSRGHSVCIYTSYRDKNHCFEEARDGTLDVRVRGNYWFIPPHVAGRLHVFMAVIRQIVLTGELLWESGKKDSVDVDGGEEEDVFIVDQVPACVPLLKLLGPRFSAGNDQGGKRKRRNQRILFYCHFPDQLLSRRDEGGIFLRIIKKWYRVPFDLFEAWAVSAADCVVANSNFTKGVVRKVFGEGLGAVRVVYPCVDTGRKDKNEATLKGQAGEIRHVSEDGVLWDGLRVLLSINRFERKKDIGLAIRAYHALGEKYRKGTRLVIAGKKMCLHFLLHVRHLLTIYNLQEATIIEYLRTSNIIVNSTL